MSTLRCTNLQDTSGGNSLTTAQIYNGAAKAWVNFNGTGTVAIRASYNVSSITDNGVGYYTLNFTTAMPDANYSAVISNSGPVNSNHTPPFLGQPGGDDGAAFSTTTLRISSYNTTNSGARADPLQFCVTIFR
jgi:hypothetical protein